MSAIKLRVVGVGGDRGEIAPTPGPHSHYDARTKEDDVEKLYDMLSRPAQSSSDSDPVSESSAGTIWPLLQHGRPVDSKTVCKSPLKQ